MCTMQFGYRNDSSVTACYLETQNLTECSGMAVSVIIKF
jgi:hypothetical protein